MRSQQSFSSVSKIKSEQNCILNDSPSTQREPSIASSQPLHSSPRNEKHPIQNLAKYELIYSSSPKLMNQNRINKSESSSFASLNGEYSGQKRSQTLSSLISPLSLDQFKQKSESNPKNQTISKRNGSESDRNKIATTTEEENEYNFYAPPAEYSSAIKMIPALRMLDSLPSTKRHSSESKRESNKQNSTSKLKSLQATQVQQSCLQAQSSQLVSPQLQHLKPLITLYNNPPQPLNSSKISDLFRSNSYSIPKSQSSLPSLDSKHPNKSREISSHMKLLKIQSSLCEEGEELEPVQTQIPIEKESLSVSSKFSLNQEFIKQADRSFKLLDKYSINNNSFNKSNLIVRSSGQSVSSNWTEEEADESHSSYETQFGKYRTPIKVDSISADKSKLIMVKRNSTDAHDQSSFQFNQEKVVLPIKEKYLVYKGDQIVNGFEQQNIHEFPKEMENEVVQPHQDSDDKLQFGKYTPKNELLHSSNQQKSLKGSNQKGVKLTTSFLEDCVEEEEEDDGQKEKKLEKKEIQIKDIRLDESIAFASATAKYVGRSVAEQKSRSQSHYGWGKNKIFRIQNSQNFILQRNIHQNESVK